MQRKEKPFNLRDLSPESVGGNVCFHSFLTPKWEITGRIKGRYGTLIHNDWQNAQNRLFNTKKQVFNIEIILIKHDNRAVLS